MTTPLNNAIKYKAFPDTTSRISDLIQQPTVSLLQKGTHSVMAAKSNMCPKVWQSGQLTVSMLHLPGMLLSAVQPQHCRTVISGPELTCQVRSSLQLLSR